MKTGLSLLAASLLLFTLSHAQSLPPQKTTENTGSRNIPANVEVETAAQETDEVITLEEFQVTGRSMADDYIATEATAGTRTGERIIDIPNNVQVLTGDFLEDFQLFDDYNELSSIPNYSPDDGGKLRGFTPMVMRDGFSRAGPSTVASTKLVEVIMGPQSTLYGQASPGGIVNYVSKRPTVKPTSRLTLSLGDYANQRAEFYSSGPLVKDKLYYLFTTSYTHSNGASQYAESENYAYLLGLIWKITKNTSLSINAEQRFSYPISGGSVPTIIVQSTPTTGDPSVQKGGYDLGPYESLKYFNRQGPYQDNYSRFDNISALLEHRFNKTFSSRLNLLYYNRLWDDKGWTSGVSFIDETQRMAERSPMKRHQTQATYAAQFDFLSQFKTGPLAHKLLFAADYTREFYDNKQWQLPNAAADPHSPANYLPYDTRFLDPWNPLWFEPNYSYLTRYTSNLKRIYDNAGATASLRTFALDQKLITSLSTRYLYKNAYIHDRNSTQSGEDSEDGFIYSIGASYKISGDKFVVYAGTSTSYEPSTTFDKGLMKPVPSEKGRGYEIGLKGILFDETLNYTLSIFRIEKTNVRETNPNYSTPDAGIPQYLTMGKVRAQGAEIAANYIPIKPLSLRLAFGYLDGEVLEGDPEDTPSHIGQRILYVPEFTGSITARYSFSNKGPLKGFKLGAKAEYMGNKLSQYEDNRVYTSAANDREYITPSVFLLGAWISYDFRISRKYTNSFAFNVRNLFDEQYITSSYANTRGRNYIFTYRLNF